MTAIFERRLRLAGGAGDRLAIWFDVLVDVDPSRVGNSRLQLSPANHRDWKAQSTSFEGMAAFNVTSSNLVGTGEPLRLEGCRVTGDLFDLLGVRPLMGRAIKPEDDVETARGTVVLSERLWRDRFGANPGVIGTSVILDDTPRTVVGVMPRTFEFPNRVVDFWVPFQYGARDFQDRGDFYLEVVGRLKPGVSIEQARSEEALEGSPHARWFFGQILSTRTRSANWASTARS